MCAVRTTLNISSSLVKCGILPYVSQLVIRRRHFLKLGARSCGSYVSLHAGITLGCSHDAAPAGGKWASSFISYLIQTRAHQVSWRAEPPFGLSHVALSFSLVLAHWLFVCQSPIVELFQVKGILEGMPLNYPPSFQPAGETNEKQNKYFVFYGPELRLSQAMEFGLWLLGGGSHPLPRSLWGWNECHTFIPWHWLHTMPRCTRDGMYKAQDLTLRSRIDFRGGDIGENQWI